MVHFDKNIFLSILHINNIEIKLKLNIVKIILFQDLFKKKPIFDSHPIDRTWSNPMKYHF